jgi:hypothetical protein
VQAALGAHAAAADSFAAALALAPGHAPALLGAGQALLAAARQHLARGAPGAWLPRPADSSRITDGPHDACHAGVPGCFFLRPRR